MRLSFVPDSIRLSPPGSAAAPPALPANASSTGTPHGKPSRALIAGVIVALLLTLLNLALPKFSKSIANSLPASWIRDASRQMTNEALPGLLPDKASSSLQDPRLAQLAAAFSSLSAPETGAPPYRLVLSREKTAIPRLMSLPSGDILLNEAFLTGIADHDIQTALLCIELGHLQLHHALRNAIDRQLIRLTVATLLGSERGSVHALAAGLTQADYTPGQLLAADQYAQDMLRTNDFPPALLAQAIHQAPGNTSPAQNLPSAAQHRAYLEQRIRALSPAH